MFRLNTNSWVILCLCIGIFVYILIHNNSKISNLKFQKDKLENLSEESQRLNTRMKLHRILEIESESLLINPDLQLIHDVPRDTIFLFNVIGNTPKLIIRYSNINWGMCNGIDQLNIRNIVEKIGKENILLLTPYSRLEDLILFKENNDISIPIYQFLNSRLFLPIESENIPFLFLVDKSFTTNMVFVPNRVDNIEFERYLNKVSSFLNIPTNI